MGKKVPELQGNHKGCGTLAASPGEREDRAGTEGVREVIIADNFPKFMTDTKPRIQAAKETPSKIFKNLKIKTSTHEHILLKLQKIRDKEKILEEGRGKATSPGEKQRPPGEGEERRSKPPPRVPFLGNFPADGRRKRLLLRRPDAQRCPSTVTLRSCPSLSPLPRRKLRGAAQTHTGSGG